MPNLATTLRYGPLRRLSRAYHLLCAREDLRRRGLAVPAGIWLCQHCPQVSFDAVKLRQHIAGVHAWN